MSHKSHAPPQMYRCVKCKSTYQALTRAMRVRCKCGGRLRPVLRLKGKPLYTPKRD